MTTHLLPAKKKLTDDDATIARMLEHASAPTLLMSIIHLTGDASLLHGDIRPKKAVINDFVSGLTEDEQRRVRAMALDALKAYRDRGCTLPPPPSRETIHAMMNFIAGEPVSDDNVPLMLEELALDGRDQRTPQWSRPVPEAERAKFHVLVIGAGMSGLLQGLRLKEAGIPFTIVEKNDSVGGTWYENRYPGCRVDIANHFYSYSFDSDHAWSEYFCRRDELLGYFQSFAQRFGIEPSIRYGTEVVSATWDDASSTWSVQTKTKDGRTHTERYNAVVSAVGQLNRPKIPHIEGRELFRGVQVHTGAWDPALDLKGKRVAVIGSGASAFQLVPAIADEVGKLYVFQRSAPWMMPNALYHERVDDEFHWLVDHVPYYGRWFRFLIFWPGTDGALALVRIDPSWPHQERSVSAANDAAREAILGYMKMQLGGDEEFLKKVTPDFPFMGKRMLQDNGSWLRALKRPNVELVNEAVTKIDATGIAGRSRHYDVDVIVYATGFHSTKFLWPIEVTGRGGKRLDQAWGDTPRAYLGITVPDFPNLFLMYGPGTNLAHAGSIIFHSECQVRYATECIKTLLENGVKAMDCRREVYEDYNARLAKELAGLVWSHPKCRSWYHNQAGLVVATSPWRLADYWSWTRGPKLEDYRLTG